MLVDGHLFFDVGIVGILSLANVVRSQMEKKW